MILLVAAIFLTAACAHGPPGRPAALVLLGGRIHADSGPGFVSALAAADGKVVFAGSDAGARRWIGPATRLVELRGKAVFPGFHDSHVHPVEGGIELGECGLGDAKTVAELLDKVRACAAARPSGWVRGGGWDLPLFADANPDKSLLDAIAPDRPVYLTAADGHSAWANSKALALAGVVKTTPEPSNGRIERSPSGEPSGTLREEAMSLVSRLLLEHGPEETLAGLRRALDIAARFGLTTLYEAAADESILDAYAELDRRGEITARVNAAFELEPSSAAAGAAALEGLRRRYNGRRLRLVGGKIFADGVIEARTAAVLEPYADRGGRGTAGWEASVLAETAAALDRLGFQVHVHAIGDRAVRMALDAIAEARRRNGPGGPPHQIAHLELIDPADLPRFKALNVVANFQPLWAYRDHYITELTEPGLGPERSGRLYPLGDALRAGARLACGSDWPVSSMNPLEAIATGATRRDPALGEGAAWLAAQRISLEDLLLCYTRGGAYANGQEDATGTLEPGKAADLVVLDADPYRTPLHALGRIRVLATFLEGRPVFEDAVMRR